MSGVVKAIGKVFKAVWKVVKVVAPIVLGVAAVVFTAGAAIPALAGTVLGGGLGGAVSGLVGALGISTTGTLGAALTGAITYAGYGAATGAITAAVTGGDVLKGAQMGALTGAATGGIGGATGILQPAAATWGPAQAIPESITVTPPVGLNAPTGGVPATPAAPGAPGATAAATPTPAQGGTGGGLLGKGGWIERNPTLASSLLQGVGNAFTKDQGEYILDREKMYSENYRGAGGLLQNNNVPNVPGLRPPSQAFAAARPVPTASTGAAYGFEYQWDPNQGRIVKVALPGK